MAPRAPTTQARILSRPRSTPGGVTASEVVEQTNETVEEAAIDAEISPEPSCPPDTVFLHVQNCGERTMTTWGGLIIVS